MVKVLSFDTSAGACSVALWRDGETVLRRVKTMDRGHAEALMPMVCEVMAAAGASFGDLDAIAVTVGPGAFTGLRVGLAAARGMALAAGLPVIGVTTLEAIAHGVTEEERANRSVLAVLDSRRRDLYAQVFAGDLTPSTDPEVISPAALAARSAGSPLVVAGDGADLARAAMIANGIEPTISQAPPWPDAAAVAAIAAARLPAVADAPPPSPLYLRPPEAKLPPRGGRLRP